MNDRIVMKIISKIPDPSRLILCFIVLLTIPRLAIGLDLDVILKDVHPDIRKWATVISVSNPNGTPTFTTSHFGNSESQVDFWPASTIKLYTVIAGTEFLNTHGMPIDSTITFARADSDGNYHRDCARVFTEMVSEVFRRSSNEDYTLLLRMMGIDYINTRFLVPDRGFPHSALMRDYVTHRPIIYENDEPQRIEIFGPDGTHKVIDHTWSGVSYAERRGATILSSTTGNCTSTAELADCVRRLIFHDVLPKEERFNISSDQADFIIFGDKNRGLVGFENRLAGPYAWEQSGERVFPQARYFHKGGLISTYVLDIGYITDVESDTHLVFALAAFTGEEQVVRDMAADIFTAASIEE